MRPCVTSNVTEHWMILLRKEGRSEEQNTDIRHKHLPPKANMNMKVNCSQIVISAMMHFCGMNETECSNLVKHASTCM